MEMVGGLDLHRGQITFDVVETTSGEVWRGRLYHPSRDRFRRWLREEVRPRAQGQGVALAVEGCTGWRYVTEEVTAAGFEAHVAEPADTQAARGRKRRAKTDRTDARLLRELLVDGDLPESWIPPACVLEWRDRARLYKSLIDQRTQWIQRIHAELFQHGVPVPDGELMAPATKTWLCDPALPVSAAARERIRIGYSMIDATNSEALPLKIELTRFGRRQHACRTLVRTHFGIGGLTAVAIWSELGDCQRFHRSMQAVRHAGLDVTVDSSDTHRNPGHLSHQGPGILRWALYEAAKCSSRPAAPDYAYYSTVKARHDGKLAALAVARKLARRCYHTLRALDPEEVYAPA